MQQPLFRVVLEGREVGPYDRRTIVGMRIKKTLTSEHVLVASDGGRLTVGDLLGQPAFQPQRTGNYSIVQATYPAALRSARGAALAIPAFRGEVQLRVQPDVLRLAGRFRAGLRWKDDRVKLPLQDIVHAQARGSEVDLGVRGPAPGLARVRLELFSPQAALELVQWLPGATPWPAGTGRASWPAALPWLPIAVGCAIAVVGVVLWVALRAH